MLYAVFFSGGGILTEKPRTQKEKIIDLLQRGQSRRQVADLLGISYSTVRTISAQAEQAGLISKIPGSYPHLYFDPVGSKNPVIIGSDAIYHRYDEKTDAEKMRISRVHLNGHYTCDVLHVGERKQVNHNGKVAIIWQSEPSKLKGRLDHYGAYRVDDQHVKFCFREGKHSLTFAIWAGDVHLTGADAMIRGERMLQERIKWVIARLRSTGWRLTDPVLKGRIHAGHVADEFAQYPKFTDDNAPVQIDASTGTAELEVFNNEDNNIISYLPEHIKALNSRIDAIEGLTGKLVTITENLTRALTETTAHITTLATPKEVPVKEEPPGVMYK